MRIVADPNIPFVKEAFGELGDITLIPGRQISPADVRDADALLVRSVTAVNAALLDGSRVKFVATATIGTDHVDEQYLELLGITFASAAGCNANSVAEYVVAAMLEIADRRHYRLCNKTLGVVGVGNVGSRVARYAQALGMRVLQNDPPRQRAENLSDFVTLDQILAEADIITVHVPLTRQPPDRTKHLFDARALADAARHPVLVNTARGAVVDNRALIKAIDGARVSGAVLDVWENEPDISPELLDIVDLGTPHIAGYSFDGKVNGTRMIYEAACQFCGGGAKWQPRLPPPAVPRIDIPMAPPAHDEDALREIIRHVYNIAADDQSLRKDLRHFDRLRAQYPVRREFFNTEVVLGDGTATLRAKLTGLGFLA